MLYAFFIIMHSELIISTISSHSNALLFLCISCILVCSVRPKPLSWFRSDTETETQMARLMPLANIVTDTETTFQRENLVTENLASVWGIIFII